MKGGKREGAGRPKGVSKTTLIKRNFQDYYDEDDIAELIATIKKQALEKPEIMKFAAEQLFGKAPQRVELSGKNGSKILVEISREIAEKNNLNAPHTSTSGNSEG